MKLVARLNSRLKPRSEGATGERRLERRTDTLLSQFLDPSQHDAAGCDGRPLGPKSGQSLCDDIGVDEFQYAKPVPQQGRGHRRLSSAVGSGQNDDAREDAGRHAGDPISLCDCAADSVAAVFA